MSMKPDGNCARILRDLQEHRGEWFPAYFGPGAHWMGRVGARIYELRHQYGYPEIEMKLEQYITDGARVAWYRLPKEV